MTKRKTHSRRNSNKRKTMRGGMWPFTTPEPVKPDAPVKPDVKKTWAEIFGFSSSPNPPATVNANNVATTTNNQMLQNNGVQNNGVQNKGGRKKRRNRKSSKK